MSASPTAYAAETVGVNPDVLYTYQGFIRASGVSKTRIREARLQGLEFPSLKVGRRLFIPGRDGIDYIRKLAELGSK